jgi:pimeloyl-ACP methyl ester carboxylesterase
MPTRRLVFPGAHGHDLAARLEVPGGSDPRAFALFAHCFTCTKNLRAVVQISRALCKEGFAVLRFDFTGLGESEGDFADTNFSSNVSDLVAAGTFMEAELEGPSLLVGHSLGGAAVLHATRSLPSVRAVATIGAPSDPAHVLRHMEGYREEIERAGAATVSLGGRPFMVKRQFLEDLKGSRMKWAVEGLGGALLILHSPKDAIVGIENAARLYQMARHPKSFVSLDDADHLLARERDSVYTGRLLAAWVSRYLEG